MTRVEEIKGISIVVCCYRGEKTIEKCLYSILNMDNLDVPVEVIIIDDGSLDNTSKIALSFIEKNNRIENRRFQYYRKVNEGLSIARNFGVSKSNYDIVSFVDEDAEVDKDFSKQVKQAFEQKSYVDCVGGKVELLNDNLEFPKLLQFTFFEYYMKHPNSIIGTNMSFRKKTLESVGGFRPEFTYRGDESALFAKNETQLKLFKDDSIIVKHHQPESLKHYLKTRYENGFFTAAIDQMVNAKSNVVFRKLAVSVISIYLPLITVSLAFMVGLNSLIIFLCLAYLLVFFRRFLFNNLLYDLVELFYKNKTKYGLNDSVLYVIYVAIYGAYKTDIGYLKGYIKYRNFKWS